MKRQRSFLFLAMFFFSVFVFLSMERNSKPVEAFFVHEYGSRVVVSAPVILMVFAGDRFLASNLETIRLSATSINYEGFDSDYLIRAQAVVARLNACNEDNYYLANGLLTWGGAVDQGNEVLREAVICRFWDGVPPFFYGLNQSFFNKNIRLAVESLNLSANRWPENRSELNRMAIMLSSELLNDDLLVLEYLQQQRDSTSDIKLREMLNKRVLRLQGLIELRQALRDYETKYGALQSLEQLVERGVLADLPEDPLRLGYELKNGHIELKKLKIAGMEN